MSSLDKRETEEITIPEISQLSQLFAEATKQLEDYVILGIIEGMPYKEREVLRLFAHKEESIGSILSLMGHQDVHLVFSYIRRLRQRVENTNGQSLDFTAVLTIAPSEARWFLEKFRKTEKIRSLADLNAEHIWKITSNRDLSINFKLKILDFFEKMGPPDVRFYIHVVKEIKFPEQQAA
jgi:di/tricarboxylate transporter